MKMPSKTRLSILLVSVFIISYCARIEYDRWRLTTPYDPFIYYRLLDRLEGKNVTIVHDIDSNPHGIYSLVMVENMSNVRSTFYVRPDSEYLTPIIPYLQYIESQGWRIGFHYDCLSRTGNETFALEVFLAELTYLRTFFNISSTRAHGDSYNPSINNELLRINHPEVWENLGLTDLSFSVSGSIGNVTFITDSHHDLQIPQEIGDRVLLLLHGDWW